MGIVYNIEILWWHLLEIQQSVKHQKNLGVLRLDFLLNLGYILIKFFDNNSYFNI